MGDVYILLLRRLKEAKAFLALSVILNEVKDPSSIAKISYGFFSRQVGIRMTTNNKPD